MTENAIKNSAEIVDQQSENVFEFVLDSESRASSSELIRQHELLPRRTEVIADIPVSGGESFPVPAMTAQVSVSPVFQKLAAPKLPELSKENRAKLLMQSPNRLFFYWSLGKNPFQTLNRAISSHTGNYTLVAKLIDLKCETEEIHRIDSEGSRWFDVNADTDYRAEIGFYAVNRPFVRVMYSNNVETPRKSPSQNTASSDDWTTTSDKFAQVLDVAGFSQDAFDVALAGDDIEAAENAMHSAFSQFTGKTVTAASGIGADEIRFVMLALASGVPLESLRFRISPGLFAILRQNTKNLSIENALAVLQDQFNIDFDEISQDEPGSAVFGASLINFPRILKTKRKLTKFAPVSSHSLL